MAQHVTHKSTFDGRERTLNRRAIRQAKYAATSIEHL